MHPQGLIQSGTPFMPWERFSRQKITRNLDAHLGVNDGWGPIRFGFTPMLMIAHDGTVDMIQDRPGSTVVFSHPRHRPIDAIYVEPGLNVTIETRIEYDLTLQEERPMRKIIGIAASFCIDGQYVLDLLDGPQGGCDQLIQAPITRRELSLGLGGMDRYRVEFLAMLKAKKIGTYLGDLVTPWATIKRAI